jgi:hypothetical protein
MKQDDWRVANGKMGVMKRSFHGRVSAVDFGAFFPL